MMRFLRGLSGFILPLQIWIVEDCETYNRFNEDAHDGSAEPPQQYID